MARGERQTGMRLPGGLLLPTFPKLGKKPPEGKIGKSKPVISRKFHAVLPDIEIVHYVDMQEHHKLEPEARKQRRQDNKEMKRSRQLHRRRKKHGR
jgi:Mg-chelatase subunit ChlI